MIVSPREAALRILEALYGDARATHVERTFDLAAFQEDAVRRAREILRRHGGVLIADSVGMGKTYIALAIIEEELARGGRVLVTTPASLRSQWRAPLGRLARRHDAVSLTGHGGPASPAAAWRATIAWASHAALSRAPVADPPARAEDGPSLVVVDEAHAFRNPRTRRYRELARVCRGARVVLLTATPVNNSLADLYAQIRLFTGDGHFCDLGVTDLRALFRAATLQPDATPPPSLQAVVRAVMIRRTRPLLRELGDTPGAPRFPRRAPPRVLHYDLETTYPGIYRDLTEGLDALTFAPFRAAAYARGALAQPSGAAELMRMVLLKRLESSAAAFTASLDGQIRFHESFLEHLREGRLLTPADHRTSRALSDTGAVQLLLGDVALDALPRSIDARALEADAAADLRALRALRSALPDAVAACDPKLDRLRGLLDTEYPAERVLVFTEFRETARHIWAALRDGGGVALIHGGGAFLGRARCGRREVVERFAPGSNGARAPAAHEAVRILIATDVLSEGMNLQDARHVVSYDLPWNPVRLIQRIGRIDRLGSPHDVVFTHTFVPSAGLDRLLGLLGRIRRKLVAIRSGVGEDGAPPLDIAEAGFLNRLARGDATALDEIERRDAAPFEAEERLRLACMRAAMKPATSRHVEPVMAAWQGSWPGRLFPGNERAVEERRTAAIARIERSVTLLAVRIAASVRLAVCSPQGDVLLDPPSAFDALSNVLAAPERGDRDEPDPARIARALAAVRRGSWGDSGWSATREKGGPAGVVARRLLAALARVPGGPDAELCRRVESILRTLASGCAAGLEHALDALVRSDDPALGDARAVCARIENMIGDERAEWAGVPADAVLIAAIEFGAAAAVSPASPAPPRPV